MNNSQSTEIIKRYYKVIVGCELSADQRRAAQLADGLIPPKTTFFSNNREINPEFAGYGVREVVPYLDLRDRPLPRPITDGKGFGFTWIL